METIWFILWILLWAVYVVLDGFDLGMGTLMPFLASNDYERRVIYNAQGPYWDGNEVWLITAGGATFAAFPDAYAVMFSVVHTKRGEAIRIISARRSTRKEVQLYEQNRNHR